MYKIAFLGQGKLAYDILTWIVSTDCEGTIYLLSKGDDFKVLSGFNNGLLNIVNIESIEELLCITFDIGFSINYWKILTRDILEIPNKHFWNIHHSYMLNIRGRYSATFAILNRNNKIINNTFGTSMHVMIEKLDAGDMLFSIPIPIELNDTSFDLIQKANFISFEMFKKKFEDILLEKANELICPSSDYFLIKSSQLPSREILEIFSSDEVFDLVRAFDFPGYEPAFYIDQLMGKVHFVLNARDEFIHKINFKGHEYFTSIKSK